MSCFPADPIDIDTFFLFIYAIRTPIIARSKDHDDNSQETPAVLRAEPHAFELRL